MARKPLPAIRHTSPANRSVFRDLGFDEAEARVLQMRADLLAALREHIKERGWTQSKAAKELGISQPRVSALVKGSWREFSADMLLVLAARAGLRPTLSLTPSAQRTSHMLDDVARILSLTPEDRLRELANVDRFFAAARPAHKGSGTAKRGLSGAAAKKPRKATRIRG